MVLSDFHTPIRIVRQHFPAEMVQVEEKAKQYRENGVIKGCEEGLMKSSVQVYRSTVECPLPRELHHFGRHLKQHSLVFGGHQTHGYTQ